MKKILLVLVVCLCIVQIACYAAEKEKGLVAYWSFDEGKGDVAKDMSGNGFDLQLTDQEWTKGKIGSALKFNLTPVELESNEKLQLGDAISVEAWVYQTEKTGDYTGIVYKWSDYLLRTDNDAEGGKFSFFVNLDGSWEPRVWCFPPELNKWYHLVGVWNGKKLTLWINGEKTEQDRAGTPTPGDQPLLIGQGFIGIIDELKIYNRALTADEVKAHFKAATK